MFMRLAKIVLAAAVGAVAIFICTEGVVKSAPDGRTLLLTSTA